MKKITLALLVMLAFCWQSNAQFTESFDTEIPATWTVLNEDGGANTWIYQTDKPNTGAGHARITYESAAHNDFLITPQISVTAGVSDRFHFFASAQSTTWTETFEVRLSTTGTAAADFTVVLGSELADTATYVQYIYDLSAYDGSDVYVAIVATDTDRFYLYVDDAVNDTPPACSEPTAISVGGITDVYSELTWTDNPGAIEYEIEYGAPGFTPGTSNAIGFGTVAQGAQGLGSNVLTPETTYEWYIRSNCDANGFSTWAGPFSFTTLMTPTAENNCVGAITIPVSVDMCTSITTGNNSGATDSDGDTPAPPAASCDSYAGGDIWFNLIVPASGNVTISGANSDDCCSYLWYEVYSGADCSALTSIACSDTNSGTDNNDPSTYETELSGLTAGSTVWIRAWDSSNDNGPGDFNLCAYEPTCVAPVVTIPTDPIDNTNCPATVDVSVSVDDLGDSATLTISAEDDMGNPVGTGGTVSATGVFTITGIPVPQTELSIIIAHESNTTCDVVLGPFVLDCPPANDLFADAIAVVCGDSVMGTTFYSTQDEASAPSVATVEADTGADNDSPWVWYSFTGSGVPEVVTLSTCGVANTTYDTELFVYTGTSGNLTLIDDGYDECGGSAENYAAETSFTSDGTTTYYIAVGGYDAGDVGDFQLNISCEIACIADAGTLTADATPVTLSAGGTATISATPNGDIVVPTDYDVTYVLTSGTGLVIEAAGATASFDVTAAGDYTIHTLVAETTDNTDPNFLDLSVIVFGTTTGGDVLGIVSANDLCASLDVTGAPITVEACTADAGTLTADATPVTLSGGTATISATPNGDIVVPTDYDVTYVLTSGASLVIEAAGATASFDVTAAGDYTIHTLVAETSDNTDPNFLDLGVIVFGTTTGGDVLGLVGTSNLCASLDVTGAAITVDEELSIDDESFSSFTYYPNPVKNTLTLSAQNAIESITMFNMLGQEMLRATPNAIDSELDMSSLQSGAYFVKVTIANVTKTIRVIKK